MKDIKLKHLLFMALCCDLGIVVKKLIGPYLNIVTDAMKIPGGFTAGISLMFIVAAALFVPKFGCGTLMCAIQSGIALALGSVGSMGALAPIGYIVPGLVIDCTLWLCRRLSVRTQLAAVLANIMASVAACLTANLIVFRLHGIPLALYAAVSAFSGSVCGVMASGIVEMLSPVLGKELSHEKRSSTADNHSSGADNGSADRN